MSRGSLQRILPRLRLAVRQGGALMSRIAKDLSAKRARLRPCAEVDKPPWNWWFSLAGLFLSVILTLAASWAPEEPPLLIPYHFRPYVPGALLLVSVALFLLTSGSLAQAFSQIEAGEYRLCSIYHLAARLSFLFSLAIAFPLIFSAYRDSLHDYLFPPHNASDKLGVLVATFGRYEEGVYTKSGKQLSADLANGLQESIPGSALEDRVVVKYANVLIGDQEMAQRWSERTGSKIVIWGKQYADNSVKISYLITGIGYENGRRSAKDLLQPFPTAFGDVGEALLSEEILKNSTAHLKFLVGILYAAEKKYRSSVQAFEEAIDSAGRAVDKTGIEVLWLHLGKAYASDNRLDEAFAAFQHTLDALQASDLPSDRKVKAEAYAGQGIVKLYTQELDQAQVLLSQALQHDSESTLATIGMGFIAMHQGQSAQAHQYFETAAELAPDWALPLYYLGYLAYAEQDYAAAVEDFKAAIVKAPNWALAHYALGDTYHQQGDCQKAIAAYQSAIEHAVNDEALKASASERQKIAAQSGCGIAMRTTQSISTAAAPTLELPPTASLGEVMFMVPWTGPELDRFSEVIANFERQNQIRVELESYAQDATMLTTRLALGLPPDAAILPSLGVMLSLAQQNALLPLEDLIGQERLAAYPPELLAIGSVEGRLFGLFLDVLPRNLVWYSPEKFAQAGYQVPQSWEELLQLEERMIADGHVPWCLGLEAGAATGWPGSDWIGDILLATNGSEVYNLWGVNEADWTSGSVREAWESWGDLVRDPARVYGGLDWALSTNNFEAAAPLFEDEAGCYLFRQPAFFLAFLREEHPKLHYGQDVDFFVFPSAMEAPGSDLILSGELLGLFTQSEEAQALARYLASAEAQAIWASGGRVAANREALPEMYSDPAERKLAELTLGARSLNFNAIERMPQGLALKLQQNVIAYSKGQSLDLILQQLAESALQEYRAIP